MSAPDGSEREKQIEALFERQSDPYRAGAAAIFDKVADAVTPEERDLVKRVFLRVLKRRPEYVSEIEVLRRASEMFHEIVSSISSKDLLANCKNSIVAEKLKENLRTRDQIRKIAAEGFDVCVRALSVAGAPGVTIHECGDSALGETPWGPDDR